MDEVRGETTRVINADVPDDDGSESDDGEWISIWDKAWPRMFLLDHLVSARGETGHWMRDFTAAVMAAAYCEYYLHKLIEITGSSESDSEYALFGALVQRARTLDVLPARLERPLRAFAKVRNSFAHNVEYRISEKTVKDLDGTLDDSMRNEVSNLQAEAVANNKGTPLEAYLRLFAATLVEELEKNLRSQETIKDSYR